MGRYMYDRNFLLDVEIYISLNFISFPQSFRNISIYFIICEVLAQFLILEEERLVIFVFWTWKFIWTSFIF